MLWESGVKISPFQSVTAVDAHLSLLLAFSSNPPPPLSFFLLSFPPFLSPELAVLLLRQCSTQTVSKAYTTHLHPFLQRDFISLLPPELAVQCLSYTDPLTVAARCSRVSRKWNSVAMDNEIWRRFFRREGWTVNRRYLDRILERERCRLNAAEEEQEENKNKRNHTTVLNHDGSSSSGNIHSDSLPLPPPHPPDIGVVNEDQDTHPGFWYQSPHLTSQQVLHIREFDDTRIMNHNFSHHTTFSAATLDRDGIVTGSLPRSASAGNNNIDHHQQQLLLQQQHHHHHQLQQQQLLSQQQSSSSFASIEMLDTDTTNANASTVVDALPLTTNLLSSHIQRQQQQQPFATITRRSLRHRTTSHDRTFTSSSNGGGGAAPSSSSSPTNINSTTPIPPPPIPPPPPMLVTPSQHRSLKSLNKTDNGDEEEDRYADLNWRYIYQQRHLLARNWWEGNCVCRDFLGHDEAIYCLQFDSDKIVSGSRDRKVQDDGVGWCE